MEISSPVIRQVHQQQQQPVEELSENAGLDSLNPNDYTDIPMTQNQQESSNNKGTPKRIIFVNQYSSPQQMGEKPEGFQEISQESFEAGADDQKTFTFQNQTQEQNDEDAIIEDALYE